MIYRCGGANVEKRERVDKFGFWSLDEGTRTAVKAAKLLDYLREPRASHMRWRLWRVAARSYPYQRGMISLRLTHHGNMDGLEAQIGMQSQLNKWELSSTPPCTDCGEAEI